MSGEKWTMEQEAAIKAAGAELLVSASAGSGKTAVLTERIVSRISKGTDIDRLLVLTFTSSAAAEMKERISDAITKKAASGDIGLQRQLTLLNRADITTIHSFCLKVARENYERLRIDPGFRVAEAAEAELIKSEVMEEVFEELYAAEDNLGFLGLVESFGESAGDMKLRELVLIIHEFARACPFPGDWLSEMQERFNIPEGGKLSDTSWGAYMMEEIGGTLKNLVKLSQKALDTVRSPGGPMEYENAILSDIEGISALAELSGKGIEDLYRGMRDFAFINLGRMKKETDPLSARKVKDLRQMVKDGVSDIGEKLLFADPGDMLSDTLKSYPAVRELCGLVRLFSEKYDEAKLQKRAADFNDLEHFCIRALLEEGSRDKPSPAAVLLRGRYEEVLIDEYQDINPTQELILSLVSRGGNRFMVGDMKQSIYRFRLADPTIFLGKYESFSLEGGAQRRIDLFYNFRSRENILEGINFLFTQLMTKAAGEMDYDDRAALRGGGYFGELSGSCGGPAELWLLEHGDSAASGDEREELSNLRAEAVLVGKRIKKMMEEDFCVWDRESGKYRPIEFRDVVILLRSSNVAGVVFARELAKMDIPVYADKSAGFYDTIEVMTILAFLQVIDNPLQDIPLLSVLKSPVYSVESGMLLDIRISGEGERFFQKLVDYSEKNDSPVLRRFLANLEKWRGLAPFAPLDRLLWVIYADTGYFDYVGAAPGGGVRQANLRALLEKGAEYEKTTFKGLFHFVKYIEKIQKIKSETDGVSGFSEEDNLVRIMSIHKSKGLEFPVVFLSNLGRMFNKTSARGKVLMHQELGIGLPFVDLDKRVAYHTVSKAAISRKIEKEGIAEELRVLYVALSRAKEKLILTGGTANLSKSSARWSLFSDGKGPVPVYAVERGRCFLDWIATAIARHRDGWPIRKAAGVPEPSGGALYENPSQWRVEFARKEDIEAEAHIAAEEAERFVFGLSAGCGEPGLDEEVFTRLSWEYPYGRQTLIPANISISEIKRLFQENRDEELLWQGAREFSLPDFGAAGKRLTAAQRGTAVHAVMEHLDFRAEHTYESIYADIRDCVEKGILTEEEARSVNIPKILVFFDSPVGRRLKCADAIYKEASFAMSLSPSEIYGESVPPLEEDIMVHGIIDCYFFEGEKLILLDYKTDRVEEENQGEAAEKYRIQMDIYMKALEASEGRPVSECLIYLFALDRELKLYP